MKLRPQEMSLKRPGPLQAHMHLISPGAPDSFESLSGNFFIKHNPGNFSAIK